MTHPFADAGRFDGRDAEARFVVEGSYLEGRRFDESLERAGLKITFEGWRRPLEVYASALENAGFLIERLREPRDLAMDAGRWSRMPMFLFIRALRAA